MGNPLGCWDTDNHLSSLGNTNAGLQPKVLMKMIARVTTARDLAFQYKFQTNLAGNDGFVDGFISVLVRNVLWYFSNFGWMLAGWPALFFYNLSNGDILPYILF